MPQEKAFDVIDYQVGIAVYRTERAVAVRFLLQNGEAAQFVLSADMATKFASGIQDVLKMLSASVAKH